MLTLAQPCLTGFFCRELQRLKFGFALGKRLVQLFVRSVTKWLRLRIAARTPEIVFTRFEVGRCGRFDGNFCFHTIA